MVNDHRVCVSIYATYFYPRSIVTKWTVLRFTNSLSFVQIRSIFLQNLSTFKPFSWNERIKSIVFVVLRYRRDFEIVKIVFRRITCFSLIQDRVYAKYVFALSQDRETNRVLLESTVSLYRCIAQANYRWTYLAYSSREGRINFSNMLNDRSTT